MQAPPGTGSDMFQAILTQFPLYAQNNFIFSEFVTKAVQTSTFIL
jgi:hypothetical protein